jgi:hypothetical protein
MNRPGATRHLRTLLLSTTVLIRMGFIEVRVSSGKRNNLISYQVIANDRLGTKGQFLSHPLSSVALSELISPHNFAVRVKVEPEDTVETLKKMIAIQTGTNWEKIVLKKWQVLPLPLHINLGADVADGLLFS